MLITAWWGGINCSYTYSSYYVPGTVLNTSCILIYPIQWDEYCYYPLFTDGEMRLKEVKKPNLFKVTRLESEGTGLKAELSRPSHILTPYPMSYYYNPHLADVQTEAQTTIHSQYQSQGLAPKPMLKSFFFY